MCDITRTFKILAGMFYFTENEKDIVNQHANSNIGKNTTTDTTILLKKER